MPILGALACEKNISSSSRLKIPRTSETFCFVTVDQHRSDDQPLETGQTCTVDRRPEVTGRHLRRT